jgi:hypothetical protein
MQSIEELIEKDFQLGETDEGVLAMTSEERSKWWPTMLAKVAKNLAPLMRILSTGPKCGRD